MDKNRRDTAKDDRPCKELNEAENEHKHLIFLPGANTSVSIVTVCCFGCKKVFLFVYDADLSDATALFCTLNCLVTAW